jgi:DNA (cytosine-5)-methyltransferase 1
MEEVLLRVGTTFSGIGAPEQALKNLKVPHVVKWACDIDKHAKQTYFANHTCEDWHDDITKINPESLEDVDLYIFGFPCQDVSTFGKQDLSRGKTALVEYSLRIISAKLPKYILFENVKGLLNRKFAPFLEEILQNLSENYNLDNAVLNSKHWGVPQNRERVFCLGTRKDIQQKFLPIEDKSRATDLRSILETNPDERYTLTDKKWEMLKRHKETQTAKKNFGLGYRFVTDKGYCLTTSYGSVPFQLIEQDGKNPRKYTERECARLQGFPDDFAFPNPNQAYKQLGNSMSVPVIEAILERITKS